MVLADLGAEVVRIDRPEAADPSATPSRSLLVNGRGRRSVAVDLKAPGGAAVVLRLARRADGFLEVFRPGVAERLGIGPTECRAANPRLVYVRTTGWGQDGPYARGPGHDLNYIGTTGVLHAIGSPASPPPVPLNVIGDYGGGGMLAALGMLAGILEARASGHGQVVDASMVDGVALLSTMFHGQRTAGEWVDERGANTLNGASPWYNVYETADGKYVTVAAGEPQFYEALLKELGLSPDEFKQYDVEAWPKLHARMANIIKAQPHAHWASLAGHPLQCIAPVWSFAEAPADPHNVARQTYVDVDGIVQPGAAPRFERTPGAPGRISRPGAASASVLTDWGFDDAEVAELLRTGTVRQRPADDGVDRHAQRDDRPSSR
jgi:alpha-methylacyl-CoA racemase